MNPTFQLLKKKQDSSKLPKLNLGMSSIILAEFRMTLVFMTMIILADIILACNHHDCHHLMIILYLPSPPPGSVCPPCPAVYCARASATCKAKGRGDDSPLKIGDWDVCYINIITKKYITMILYNHQLVIIITIIVIKMMIIMIINIYWQWQ